MTRHELGHRSAVQPHDYAMSKQLAQGARDIFDDKTGATIYLNNQNIDVVALAYQSENDVSQACVPIQLCGC
jgi:hypothetical protein